MNIIRPACRMEEFAIFADMKPLGNILAFHLFFYL